MTELLAMLAQPAPRDTESAEDTVPDGLHHGIVVHPADANGDCAVEIEGPTLAARRAAGCLLAPEPDDLVLLSASGGAIYVLSVLERAAADRPARLDHASGLSIEAARGDIALRAGGTASLIGGRGAHIAAPDLTITARSAALSAERSFVRSQEATLHADRLTVVAELLKTLVDRSIGSFQSVLRKIAGVDHTQAHTHSVDAQELLSLRGRQGMVSARSDMRIDAERIHIG